ncbi:MAG: VOC family protein [Pseudomonadales bacterium]|jgi:catechol 2,3-dioxygenase-like lactoylglutathione lyase family enzyme|nr:VOC family protein [Pseudomonadales bacterium]
MIRGFDHVALPMQNVEDMIAFYKTIGAEVIEEVPGFLHAAYLGNNKINLHMPAAWQSPKFELRGPAAQPGCGDLCFAWEGSMDDLQNLLAIAGAEIIEGPCERRGGLNEMGTSVYERDPDNNLLEFITYENVQRDKLARKGS